MTGNGRQGDSVTVTERGIEETDIVSVRPHFAPRPHAANGESPQAIATNLRAVPTQVVLARDASRSNTVSFTIHIHRRPNCNFLSST